MMENVKEMIGMTMVSVEQTGEGEIVFKSSDGRAFLLYHDQDCCESVVVESIAGDLSDLVGEPIVFAEEVASNESQMPEMEGDESFTWTFYKFATRKGYVDIRWYGKSNGYYSESVSVKEIKN